MVSFILIHVLDLIKFL